MEKGAPTTMYGKKRRHKPIVYHMEKFSDPSLMLSSLHPDKHKGSLMPPESVPFLKSHIKSLVTLPKEETQQKVTPDASFNKSKQSYYHVVSSTLEASSTIFQPVTLTAEQQRVLDAVRTGANVFYTGGAGVGKSILGQQLYHVLKHEMGKRIQKHAPTSAAATLLEGDTIDSLIGLRKEDMDQPKAVILEKCSKIRAIRERWQKIDVLLFDEISMLRADRFDLYENVARVTRPSCSHLLWGGIQLIATGDFFQLPPIPPPGAKDEFPFCFKAEMWNKTFTMAIELKECQRQKDKEFVALLNDIRKGSPLSEETKLRLRQMVRTSQKKKIDPDALILCTHRHQVHHYNDKRLKKLPKDVKFTYKGSFTEIIRSQYEAQDKKRMFARMRQEKLNSKGREATTISKPRGIQLAQLYRDCPLDRQTIDEGMELRIGTRVRLKQKLNQGLRLVNGSKGVIVGFDGVDSETFKIEDRPDLKLHPPNPIVEFDHGMTVVIRPYVWANHSRERILELHMLPLVHAWASTIHDAQGATLPKACIDMSQSFTYGQFYVAASRVRAIEDLSIISYNIDNIQAHPAVKEFYEKLG